jgi:hypothetical protein
MPLRATTAKVDGSTSRGRTIFSSVNLVTVGLTARATRPAVIASKQTRALSAMVATRSGDFIRQDVLLLLLSYQRGSAGPPRNAIEFKNHIGGLGGASPQERPIPS